MRRENINLSIIILLVVAISLSATYAFIKLNASSNETSGEAGCFEVNYSGQEINNSSLQSTTNYLDGAQSEITLSKNEDCEIYTEASIYLYTNEIAEDEFRPDLSNGALKYKVMQGTTELGSGSITATGDTLLKDQIILTETATTYTVYLWIDPEVSRGSYHGKQYSGYLYASSTQSSTITK